MLCLVDRLAPAVKEMKTDLHNPASMYLSELGLDLHHVSIESFPMVLSWDEATPKLNLRVRLFHWLSQWVAQEKKKTPGSALTRTPDTGVPWPSPLNEKH